MACIEGKTRVRKSREVSLKSSCATAQTAHQEPRESFVLREAVTGCLRLRESVIYAKIDGNDVPLGR